MSEPNNSGSISFHAYALDGNSENGPGMVPVLPRPMPAIVNAKESSIQPDVAIEYLDHRSCRTRQQPGESIPTTQDRLIPLIQVLQKIHGRV